MVGGMKPFSIDRIFATIRIPPDAMASPVIDLVELTGI
jgi:hypothetical protein